MNKTINFTAKGTVCESCSEIIKKQAKEIQGVEKIEFNYSTERGSAQLYLAIKFNDLLVVNTEFDAEGSINPMLDSPITLLIPPLTDVQVLVGIESGTNKNWSMTFTGKQYGGS